MAWRYKALKIEHIYPDKDNIHIYVLDLGDLLIRIFIDEKFMEVVDYDITYLCY